MNASITHACRFTTVRLEWTNLWAGGPPEVDGKPGASPQRKAGAPGAGDLKTGGRRLSPSAWEPLGSLVTFVKITKLSGLLGLGVCRLYRSREHDQLLERIPKPLPLTKTSQQRPHTNNPEFPEFERQTGARSFAWSSAVQDDLAVARDLLLARSDFIGRKPDSARNDARIRQKIELVAKVNDVWLLAALDHTQEFFGGDPQRTQLT